MPFRIETDDTLRRALGTDGAEWASAYINQHQHAEGDARHHELTAWFDCAVRAGAKAERETIAAGLISINDDWPMRASDIGIFLQADQFAGFLAIWTRETAVDREAAIVDWRIRAERDSEEEPDE